MTKEEERIYELPVVSVRLVKDAPILDNKPFDSPESAVQALGSVLQEFDREVIAVVNLKTDLRPINVTFASMGGLSAAVAEPRELLKAAVLSNAAGMIMMHTHPSGSLVPSKEDVKITDRMVQLGGLMGIPLNDHVIVAPGKEEYFSFQSQGQMPQTDYHLKTEYRDLEIPATVLSERKEKISIRAKLQNAEKTVQESNQLERKDQKHRKEKYRER